MYVCVIKNSNWDSKMMVIIDKWSVSGGGSFLKFGCITVRGKLPKIKQQQYLATL